MQQLWNIMKNTKMRSSRTATDICKCSSCSYWDTRFHKCMYYELYCFKDYMDVDDPEELDLIFDKEDYEMSSFMRTIERNKVRTAMKDEKEKKVNKKLKAWWDEYRKKKHEFLEKRKESGYVALTRKEYEARIRRKKG